MNTSSIEYSFIFKSKDLSLIVISFTIYRKEFLNIEKTLNR